MSKQFKTVSALQGHLKNSIVESIEDKLVKICIDVAQQYIQKNVYEAYIPTGEFSYDRTYDLLDAVTVANINVGTKYVTFEVFMDSSKINPQIRSSFDSNAWNAHADVTQIDVSEYIPLWIEEGTSGSLWDRDGAHYMESTYVELSGGRLAQELASELRRKGWSVKRVS